MGNSAEHGIRCLMSAEMMANDRPDWNNIVIKEEQDVAGTGSNAGISGCGAAAVLLPLHDQAVDPGFGNIVKSIGRVVS